MLYFALCVFILCYMLLFYVLCLKVRQGTTDAISWSYAQYGASNGDIYVLMVPFK